MRPEETYHADIMSLPPATWMTVSALGVRRSQYWAPVAKDGLVPRNPSEAWGAVRSLFFGAVEARLGGDNVGVFLSGGLDSSSIAAVAAGKLSDRGQRLAAVSAVLPEDRDQGMRDERSSIETFSAATKIRTYYMDQWQGGPLDDIDQPLEFERSPRRISWFYLLRELENFACAKGIGVMLHGALGEFSATNWGRGYLAELAVRGHWPHLIRELNARRLRTGQRRRSMLKQEIRQGFFRTARFTPRFLLTKAFCRYTAKPGVVGFRWPSHRRNICESLANYMNGHAIRACQPLPKCQLRYPFADRALLEFSLSAPPDLKVHDGYQRYMIRAALEGVVHSPTLWGTRKIPLSLDYPARFNAQLGAARTFLASISPGDPVREVVDTEAVSRCLGEAPSPRAPGWNALVIVPENIYLICFLRQFPEFRL